MIETGCDGISLHCLLRSQYFFFVLLPSLQRSIMSCGGFYFAFHQLNPTLSWDRRRTRQKNSGLKSEVRLYCLSIECVCMIENHNMAMNWVLDKLHSSYIMGIIWQEKSNETAYFLPLKQFPLDIWKYLVPHLFPPHNDRGWKNQ